MIKPQYFIRKELEPIIKIADLGVAKIGEKYY